MQQIYSFQRFGINLTRCIGIRNGKDFQDEHDYPTFTEYIENEDYFGDELCNLQDEEILILKPYCKSLERKGFGCYVDTGDHELVVTLKIN